MERERWRERDGEREMERERWRERDGERDALLLLRRRKGLGNYTLQACHELAKCINQRLKRSLHVFRRCFANGVLLYAASSTPESLSPILFLYFLLSYPSNRRIRFPFGALSSSLTSFFTRFFLKVYFFFFPPRIESQRWKRWVPSFNSKGTQFRTTLNVGSHPTLTCTTHCTLFHIYVYKRTNRLLLLPLRVFSPLELVESSFTRDLCRRQIKRLWFIATSGATFFRVSDASLELHWIIRN